MQDESKETKEEGEMEDGWEMEDTAGGKMQDKEDGTEDGMEGGGQSINDRR